MATNSVRAHIFRSRNSLEFPWLKTRSNGDDNLFYGRRLPFPLRPLPLLHRPYPLLVCAPPFRPCFLLSHPPLLPLLRHRLPRLFSLMSSSNSEAVPSTPTAKTVRVVIKGRVQGVFYRNWTIDNANALGLNGWVRNRRDGSVEALFSGSPERVEEMEQRCRRGPPDAMVTGLQVFPSTDDPGTGFERKPTV